MEEILWFLVQLVGELFGEMLLELVLGAYKAAFDRPSRNPVLAAIGYLVLGGIVGGVLVMTFPERLMPPPPRRGVSLVLAPIAGGAAMAAWGAFRRGRGHATSQLATWYGGAAFLFGLALVRFLLVS